MRRRGRSHAAVAAVAFLATGCAGSSTPGATAGRDTVTVFAAASLTDAFQAEAAAYAAQGGSHVQFSFAGSQDLVAQVQQGAPADVLATADTATMDRAVQGRGLAPQVFARNRLVIAVAPGNPAHIQGVVDLARPGLDVVLADPSVPAGSYAATALAAAHVTVHPRSLELDVRSVLTKVELGEADAGIVYATDATAAGGKVSAVPVPESPVATYPIVALDPAGRGFAAYVVSAAGQRIMQRFGFLPP